MREATQARSYAAALSVLVVTEWLYLDWASRAPQPRPANFVHAECSRCTTVRVYATSSSFCARNWIGSAPSNQIFAATSSGGASASNLPSSMPPIPSDGGPQGQGDNLIIVSESGRNHRRIQWGDAGCGI
jgi:hypothetical protein